MSAKYFVCVRFSIQNEFLIKKKKTFGSLKKLANIKLRHILRVLYVSRETKKPINLKIMRNVQNSKYEVVQRVLLEKQPLKNKVKTQKSLSRLLKSRMPYLTRHSQNFSYLWNTIVGLQNKAVD